jgi:hypothetical protein
VTTLAIPEGFNWKQRWPVGKRLIIAGEGATVTAQSEHGITVLMDEPYEMGKGAWRAPPPTFDDIKEIH